VFVPLIAAKRNSTSDFNRITDLSERIMTERFGHY
jgi:hypothetical protein